MSLALAQTRGAQRRRAARTGSALPGIVRSLDGRVKLPCRFFDMSASGAGVTLQSLYQTRFATDLPDEVFLVMTLDRIGFYGRIMWRDGLKFGVRFTSAFVRVNAQGWPLPP